MFVGRIPHWPFHSVSQSLLDRRRGSGFGYLISAEPSTKQRPSRASWGALVSLHVTSYGISRRQQILGTLNIGDLQEQ